VTHQGTLLVLIIVSIPALASIIAAVVAGVFASKTRRADAEAQHARELETRISDKKYSVYEPMINLIRDVLARRTSDENSLTATIENFSTWIGIYGSDEAVQVFHQFMQCTYHNAPIPIQLRLYGDFLIAARKDMGYPETAVQREHLLGMRITDIYSYHDVIDQSFEEISDRLSWRAPWLSNDLTPSQNE
jgi:hypothetical protein